MSTPTRVAEARLTLARRLASLRQAAGFTQAHAAYRLSYSRSVIARAEATGVCSRDFCRRAGQLYGAGDELADEHDGIEAFAIAARSQAAGEPGEPGTMIFRRPGWRRARTKPKPRSPRWRRPARTAANR